MARIWRGALRTGFVLSVLVLAMMGFFFTRYSQQIADSASTPESWIYVLCDTASINLVNAEVRFEAAKKKLESDQERVATAKQEALGMMPSLMVAALIGAIGGSELSDSVDSTFSVVGESYKRREEALVQSQGEFGDASVALETARSDDRSGHMVRISPHDPRWYEYLASADFAALHRREMRPRIRGLAPAIAAAAAFVATILCSFLAYFATRLTRPLLRWLRAGYSMRQ